MAAFEAFAIPAVFGPLLGAGLVPLAGRYSRRARDAVAVAFAVVAAASTLLLLLALRADPVRVASWIPVLGIGFDLRIDALGVFVAAIAGTIGLLVVVYSLAYMRHAEEEGYSLGRYYGLVLLFIGAMIGLALADSLLAFYIFWETVGLCSFALISFYHRDPGARRAGLKAFAVTRIGDIGLLVALVAVWSAAGVVSFTGFESAGLSPDILSLAAGGVLLAAIGKSAQVPLHVWLPDAMEAPTPISALIHAATMVNAGVYLVARAYPAFAGLGWWTASLLWVGAGTAVVAAVSAYAESDLKRVLAHSTVSQLGFMIAAVGAGALVASQFHLLSQAIFKALLFLASGAVIQAVGTRDLFSMGGLRRRMPATSVAFLAGVLAMVGIPVFNGFWSKELLLESVLEHGHAGPFLVLVVATFLTAAYSWRAYHLVFRAPGREVDARDAPMPMTAAIVVLSVGAATSGILLGPYSGEMAATMPAYPVAALGIAEAAQAFVRFPTVLVPTALAAISAYLVLAHGPRFERRLPDGSALARTVRSGFLLDAAYARAADGLGRAAARMRAIQTGDLNVNAAAVLGTVVAVTIVLLLEVM